MSRDPVLEGMQSSKAHNGGVCGRYAAAKDAAELAGWFHAEQLPEVELPHRFNIAPTSEAYIVIDEGASRAIAVARWGLIPSWSKDSSRASRMINARVETIAEKPAYRAAFRRRRCLVPADGYFEWQVGAGPRTPKQPYFIHRSDGAPIAMAGLFEDWEGPAGVVRSFTIVTQDATEGLASIHDRMPVIVDEGSWSRWLDPTTQPDEAMAVLTEAVIESHGLAAYPVSTAVNKAGNDGPQLLTPLGPALPVG